MTFSAESLLLLDSSNVRPDDGRIASLRRTITAGIDWGEFLRLAIPHGLLPLAGHNLALYAGDLVPAATLAQLAKYRKRVEQRNQQQAAELLRLLGQLDGEGIRALAFKGPLLAMSAYGDLGLRESHDLDVWVEHKDLPAAGKLLRAGGYCPVHHVQGTPFRITTRDGGQWQTEFQHPETGVLIELHDELQSQQFSFSPGFDEVWKRREQVVLEGVAASALGVEDLLLALAVHGSKHMWRRLSWVVDIVGLVGAHPRLDWETALSRARRWRCKRRLLSATTLAGSLYGLPLPERYRREGRRRSYTRFSATTVQQQVIEGVEERTVRNFAGEAWHHARNADALADRVRIFSSYLRKALEVEPTRMLRPMPPRTMRFYRISRGVRNLFAGRVAKLD